MPLKGNQWEGIKGAVHDTTGSVADPNLQIRGGGGWEGAVSKNKGGGPLGPLPRDRPLWIVDTISLKYTNFAS